MTSLEIALQYIALGWNPVPIPFKKKRPVDEAWQKRKIDASNAERFFNCQDQNIGVQLGLASDGLTDVDLDCDEARAAAAYLLPKTHVFGRPSARASHWLYTTDLCKTIDKAVLQIKDGAKVLLELRIGGGGAGAQTVFPRRLIQAASSFNGRTAGGSRRWTARSL